MGLFWLLIELFRAKLAKFALMFGAGKELVEAMLAWRELGWEGVFV